MFVNLFRDGDGALLEDRAAGDRSIRLTDLDERAAKCLAAVIEGTASFELSRAAALLFMAGVRPAQRDARRHHVTS